MNPTEVVRTSPAIRGGGTRDLHIDTIKGLGIFLVVWGHSGAPFEHYIYLFHMAIFFIASGYLWNDNKVESAGQLRTHIIKRMKTLWLPYVACNCMFTILNNAFIRVGVYTTDVNFLTIATNEYDRLSSWMSPSQIISSCLKTLVFLGQTQLGGTTWFLRTLFIVLVGYGIVRFIELKYLRNDFLDLFLVVIAAVGVTWTCLTKKTLPLSLQNCFAAFLAFYAGIAIHKYDVMNRILGKRRKFEKALLSTICLVLLFIAGHYGSVGMSSGQVTNVLFFILVSVVGWAALWIISEMLPNMMAEALTYLGRHSLCIMLLHFAAFKIVSALYVNISGGNSLLIASHPVISSVSWIWVIYIIAGIAFPLLLERLYINVKDRRLK